MEGKRPQRGRNGISKDTGRGGHGSSTFQDPSEPATLQMKHLAINPTEPQSNPELLLPSRPSYGIAGMPLQLLANYFRLQFEAGMQLYTYSIKISPEVKGPTKKRRLIGPLLQNDFFRRDHPTVATDHEASLITPHLLNLGPSGSKQFQVPYYNEVVGHLSRAAVTYDIIVTNEQLLPLYELLDYLSSENPNGQFDQKEDVIHALNAIVARVPSTDQNIISAGRNSKFFPISNLQHLGDFLRVCRGYYASVRSTVGSLLVNVHTCTSAFYPETNLLTLMRLLHRNGIDLAPFLDQLQVSAHYLKVEEGPNQGQVRPVVRTIIGVGASAQDTKFPCPEFDQENDVSVQDYFKKKYNIALEAARAPVVEVRGANRDTGFRVWIPPELCEVLPFQLYRRVVPPQLTNQMIEVALLNPVDTARRILHEGCRIMGITENQVSLKKFGLRVQPEMITVEGRILSTPQPVYGSTKKTPQNGSWNLKGVKFHKVGKPNIRWTYFTICDRPDEKQLKVGLNNFQKALKDCGMKGASLKPGNGYPEKGYTKEDLPEDEDFVRQGITMAAAASVDLLLVILSKGDMRLYPRIKYHADVCNGVHTVCTVVDKFCTQGPTYFANLTLKVNLKAGGINQSLKRDDLGILQDGKTIVMGYDVTHPGPGAQKNTPSIAGMVASIDRDYAQWAPSVKLQENAKQEMVKGPLVKMVYERLTYWKRCNGSLPSRILVYRDGVSEGQYRQVLTYELSGIKEVCESLYTGDKPKISILVVGKRHHTRLFTKNAKGGVQGNPQAGTVVDKGITMEKGYDFFLQAHHALKGTARPIHYVVVHDEIGLGVDELQKTTHNLCYLYGRATKAVSVCPPAYFADLLCDRARCYLQEELSGRKPKGTIFDRTRSWNGTIHGNLQNTMFYI